MKNHRVNIIVTILFISAFGIGVSAQQVKLACVGNSITYGYGFSDPANQSYPGQLQALLGTSAWTVGNFGSSGRTMLKGGGYSYWDDRKYMEALRFAPQYVMIELGTNDSKRWLWDWLGSQFKADYKAMVSSFVENRHSPNPEIWIGLLIPGENQEWDIYHTYIRDKVNPEIKAIALEMGLGLIDLYAPFDGHWPEYYLTDGVHPSVQGAGVIAEKVKEMLLMPKPQIAFANGVVSAPNGYGFQWYFNGAPVAAEQGGQSKDLTVVQSGKYKVSIQINAGNETRIVSNELDITANTVPVTGVIVTPSSATVTSGGTTQLTATVSPSNATNKQVSWVSSNPAVATVNSTGLVSGIAAGSATITATTSDGGFTATSAITVTAGASQNINVVARGVRGNETIELRVGNALIASWRLSKSYQNYSATANNGQVSVHFINDASGRDVQVDYVSINSVTYQSEDQVVNTGFYQNGVCGGSYSEWLNCNGYIDYTTASAASSMTTAENVTTGDTMVNQINIYPNPAMEGRFFLTLPEMQEGVTVQIFDDGGRLLHQNLKVESKKLEIEEHLKAGVYLIKVQSGKVALSKKLVVK
jgi:lysophospholipase L1-like esterase